MFIILLDYLDIQILQQLIEPVDKLQCVLQKISQKYNIADDLLINKQYITSFKYTVINCINFQLLFDNIHSDIENCPFLCFTTSMIEIWITQNYDGHTLLPIDIIDCISFFLSFISK